MTTPSNRLPRQYGGGASGLLAWACYGLGLLVGLVLGQALRMVGL